MSLEATPAAAMRLRVRVRAEGVSGVPGVRIRPGHGGPAGMFELVIEDHAEPSDAVRESRGIRFFLDPVTAGRLGDVVLDLEGGDAFVLRSAQ